ncbi:MAG: recombination regulator RecX [Clostridium sp.]|nr:recombination regulator RecX [Prevotella sp.]MCM1429583.1 recombination regulator RecX [Clostridium sp.]MCM1476010.1 recombination regulator RecX [Muribaculaceae bacterium]
MKKPPTPESLRLKMASLCARSEQCSADIRLKLMKSGISGEDVNEIMKFLVVNKFIDDWRFAHAFAADKLRFNGWGPLKIRYALASKRLDDKIISTALAELDEADIQEALMKAARSKARTLNLHDPADADKLIRHLVASRGFTLHSATEALKSLKDEPC